MLTLLSSAQSHELKTTLAGHIARALAVFCVDEVVIFDDGQASGQQHHRQDASRGKPEQEYTGYSDPSDFLVHLLSYLETPPHLRRSLFPLHPNLRSAGTLPSLDMPHHLRTEEWCLYREGVTVEGPGGQVDRRDGTAKAAKDKRDKRSKKAAAEMGEQSRSYVEAGLRKKVAVEASIPPNTRVTLKFADDASAHVGGDYVPAEAVAPDAPREGAGYYWGYAVRTAPSISAVFTECPFDGGYDFTVGTSERGVPLQEIPGGTTPVVKGRHTMIVFGGVAGLEAAVKADEELAGMGVVDPQSLFDHWVNLCPGQGSRTIRTEEALWIGLMGLRGLIPGEALP